MNINYKGYIIVMKGLNHFNCPKLKLFGYSSVRTIERLINKHIAKGESK